MVHLLSCNDLRWLFIPNNCTFVVMLVCLKGEGEESKIRLMPDYLKNYITEFNYLFHQIYRCTQVENANEEHECFYNFGNNLRKFLEAYLFYKYPVHQDIKDKLSLFFKEDQADYLSDILANEVATHEGRLQ